MAVEAVLKVNEAEEKGNEVIKEAAAKAREIIQNAEAKALSERGGIIGAAGGMRDEIIRAAVEKAMKECEGMAAQSGARMEGFRNPGEQKLDGAVKIVLERIVKET